MDTSAARSAIFSRIRLARRQQVQDLASEQAQIRLAIDAPQPGPLPDLAASTADEIRLRFITQAQKMADTVETVASMEKVPLALAQYLSAQGIAAKASGWQSLQDLPWHQAGIEFSARKASPHDAVGITGVFCALAETGSLLLLSGPGTWSSTSLLPETHIAILPASRIVAHMEAAFALVRSERGELPRNAQFVSGPSRTGDIEQTIVLGAHGPYRVHVVIVADA